jgi:hypothetical protein
MAQIYLRYYLLISKEGTVALPYTRYMTVVVDKMSSKVKY